MRLPCARAGSSARVQRMRCTLSRYRRYRFVTLPAFGHICQHGATGKGGLPMSGRYFDLYAESLRDPQAFWARAAREIHWDTPYRQVLDESAAPLPRWFCGGELNTCYNAIDRHVQNGRAEQAAVIWESPVTGGKRVLTFRELQTEVARFAGVLRSLDVEKGD